MPEIEWLLFLSQLPASPSSLRVMIWRKMRAAGATSLQNGVWVLPHTAEQECFMEELLAAIRRQGGSGQIFVVHALNQAVQAELLQRFRADRDQDYDEFIEQCAALLAELEKETERQKFSFAELEENEHSLRRLVAWFAKIQKRDFFEAERAHTAQAALQDCRRALHAFTRRVYSQEGLEPPAEDDALSDES